MTTTATRRALLVSSDDDPMDDVQSDLAAAGYEIVHCHSTGAPGFPCAALTEAGCPIEVAPVDVTIDVRQHPWPHPTPREQGVTCSVRAGIPVVVIGSSHHPFRPWAETCTEHRSHVVAECERAIHAVTASLEQEITRAVRSVLARHAGAPPFVVEVERRRGRLHVRIIADLTTLVAGIAATRAAAAIRGLDSRASAIEIEVVAPEAFIRSLI